ncbi:DNA alkylation repair protein [Leptospira jelokensis]|uniref:DNA alkylation repair protein n=1 Tax=Leptospira jelokensis TaxID=2484931 RepID=A0A4Z1A3T5_9LEPT|nr:DNA alkylation repair protein [Leptospira jelokensis]TGL75592.1 DNA alkylation repair protein [Leptospira jelokensis]
MSDWKQTFLKELEKVKNPKKAAFFPRFFKTGPGEYGEGDKFLGITVPNQRKIAKLYANKLSLDDLEVLIKSPIHEVRLTCLFILVFQYKNKGISEIEKGKIVSFYFKNTKYINNWDLADASADKILGDYYFLKDKTKLLNLKDSKNLWENRIAILSSFDWIRKGQYAETIYLCENFLSHPHDLIHKATGWMLREIGNRDKKVLIQFLEHNVTKMPRTMLRYAIEKLNTEERKKWLSYKKET